MSFDASQIPAELRTSQILSRIDQMTNLRGSNDLLGDNTAQNQYYPQPQDFKAMAAMMEAQMLGEAFKTSSDSDEDSNPISSMMMNLNSNPMMMGLNPNMNLGMNNPWDQMNNLMPNTNMALLPQAMPYNVAASMLPRSNSSEQALMPVNGPISSEYGHRTHPVTGHHHFHSGVDIAANYGTPIRAPWQGEVVYVGPVQGFGPNTVVVSHPNQVQADGKIIYSIFGHNQDVYVRQGDYIQQGDILGTVGSEGRSTGPHLHWETRVAEPNLQGLEVFNKQLSMTVDPLTFA